MGERPGSVVIEAVYPLVGDGRFPVKRILGEVLHVEADIFKEGHDVLGAAALVRRLLPEPSGEERLLLLPVGNDRWAVDVPLSRLGRHQVRLEAWPDSYRTWVSEVQRKLAAQRSVKSELEEGAALLERAA